jgi:hypothetical protein
MKTLLLAAALFLLPAAAFSQTVPNVLSWNDTNAAPNNDTGADILRGNTPGGAKTFLASVGADATTYTDNVPVPAATTTYCYQVVAKINSITAPPSNESCKTIAVPNPITGLSVK